MALERIPLGLITDNNGVASGLGQFTLSSADLGDVCDTTPTGNQALIWDGTQFCPSTLPNPGGGGGGGYTPPVSPTAGDIITADGSNNFSNKTTSSTFFDNGIAAKSILTTSVGTSEIDNDAVTFDKFQNISTDTILGRDTASTGSVEALSPTQARSILNVENGATADQTAGEIKTRLQSNKLTASEIADDAIGEDQLAAGVNSDIALGVAANTTANAAIPNQTGSPGDILVIPGGGSNFSSKVSSGTLFDNGIAAKGIVVNSTTPNAGDIITADGSNNFSNKTTSSTFFDNGIAAKNIVVDIGSAGAGDIITANGSGKFADKVTSATLFDEGLAANNLNTIGDVGYTSVENGMTLVRAGGQWKALSPPQFFNVKGEGGNDFEGDSLGLAAAIDHGLALSGLGDDDHPQYVLSAGTRAMTELTVNNNISTSGIIAKNIVPNSEDGLNIRAVNISATTSVSSASITGVNILGTSITGTNVTATTQVSAPTVRGGTSVLGTLGSFTNVGATNVTGTNIVANTLAPFVGESATTLSVTANEINLSGDLNIPDYTSLTGAGVPMVLHREVGAPVASSNSTSLAELVSFTLPANSLAIGDIDIRIRGRQLAQGSNLRWNFKIGGTNILNSNISQGTFSDMTVYTMHIQISKTATDKQLVTANFTQSTGSSSAAGKGSWAGTHRVGQITNDGVTADESTALALSLEAQQANSAQTVTVDQFRVTLIPDPA